jgi:deoxycytidylate deaminase
MMLSLSEAGIHFNHLNLKLAGLPCRLPNSMEQSFFNTALRLAAASYHPKFKVGALIVHKNRIVASGNNSLRTHPISLKWKSRSLALCAEMDAILQAQKDDSWEPRKATIYVARVGRDGEPKISFPCDGCTAALMHVGIKKIICADWNNNPIFLELN